METVLRNDLYAHLQRLPVAFHDGWQSGQLLSRATTDLSVIRRFLSFGLIFLVINSITFLAVIVLLLHIYWPLGLVVAASAVPLFSISARFTAKYNVMARRMQDEQGDVATLVEETASGIRVIKAFGRRDHMAERFAGPHPAAAGHGGRPRPTMVARTWPTLRPGAQRHPGRRAGRRGGRGVGRARSPLGDLVAFVTLQLMLIWPIDALGYIIANGQEAMTAADRVYEVLDTEPTIVDRPGAATLVRSDGPRDGAVRGRRSSATRERPGRSCAASTWTIQPGETHGHRRHHRQRQDHAGVARAPAASSRPPAGSPLDGRDIARADASTRCARWSGSRSRRRRCSR